MSGNDVAIPAELTKKQEEAIAALLASPTILGAARAAKVDPKSIRRWLKNPVFAGAYESARGSVVHASLNAIQSALPAAIRALTRDCDSQDFAARQHATALIMQTVLKGIEFGVFNDRLRRVEERQAAGQ